MSATRRAESFCPPPKKISVADPTPTPAAFATATSVAVNSKKFKKPFRSCHVANRVLNPKPEVAFCRVSSREPKRGLVSEGSVSGSGSRSSGSVSVAGAGGVCAANPDARVSSDDVSVLPRIVTSTPAASTGTFSDAPGAQVGRALLGESEVSPSNPPRGERGERGELPRFGNALHEPARRSAGDFVSFVSAPPRSFVSFASARKEAASVSRSVDAPGRGSPFFVRPGDRPGDTARVAAASEDWRKIAARLAVFSSARLGDGGFASVRDVSAGATGSPSRSRAPRSLFDTNSYSHVSNVSIWPVYSASSTRTDSIGPDAKVTSTSLTCRKPTEPTWMVTPRAFVTRTWRGSSRDRRAGKRASEERWPNAERSPRSRPRPEEVR